MNQHFFVLSFYNLILEVSKLQYVVIESKQMVQV